MLLVRLLPSSFDHKPTHPPPPPPQTPILRQKHKKQRKGHTKTNTLKKTIVKEVNRTKTRSNTFQKDMPPGQRLVQKLVRRTCLCLNLLVTAWLGAEEELIAVDVAFVDLQRA
jgi:hypothetical protein